MLTATSAWNYLKKVWSNPIIMQNCKSSQRYFLRCVKRVDQVMLLSSACLPCCSHGSCCSHALSSCCSHGSSYAALIPLPPMCLEFISLSFESLITEDHVIAFIAYFSNQYISISHEAIFSGAHTLTPVQDLSIIHLQEHHLLRVLRTYQPFHQI